MSVASTLQYHTWLNKSKKGRKKMIGYKEVEWKTHFSLQKDNQKAYQK